MRTTLALAAVATLAAAQTIPLPPTYDAAWSFGNPTAQVLLEEFADLLCPDCASAWPTIQQVMQHYGPDKIQYKLHQFPLPYHTWAFSAAWMTNTINTLTTNPAASLAWVNYMFAGAQENYWNSAVATNTTEEIHSSMAAAAASVTGLKEADLLAGYSNSNLDEATRISWKFGCSRGVSGTPTSFVNGILVGADSTWTLADWQQLLDPLFSSSDAKVTADGEAGRIITLPSGTKVRSTGRS